MFTRATGVVGSCSSIDFIIDDRGNYLDVNPAACRLTGYSRDELCSMSVADLTVSPGWLDLSKLSLLQQTGQVRTEIALRHREGSTVYALLDAVALASDRFLVFCTDITRRRYQQGVPRPGQPRFRADLGLE